MALVQCEHLQRFPPVGKHDDRSVGEPDFEIGKPLYDCRGFTNIVRAEGCKKVGLGGDIVQESHFCCVLGVLENEVVELGEDERGQQKRTSMLVKRLRTLLVPPLVWEKRRQKSARIEQNHEVPKPFYVIEGELEHIVNGKKYVLGPGMIGHVRPPDEVIHRGKADGPPCKALVIWAPGGEGTRIAERWEAGN